jgi:uncharacterized protein (DUF1778 family)
MNGNSTTTSTTTKPLPILNLPIAVTTPALYCTTESRTIPPPSTEQHLEATMNDLRRRTKRLVLRVRPSEQAIIERAALNEEKYLAEYIRDAALSEASRQRENEVSRVSTEARDQQVF